MNIYLLERIDEGSPYQVKSMIVIAEDEIDARSYGYNLCRGPGWPADWDLVEVTKLGKADTQWLRHIVLENTIIS